MAFGKVTPCRVRGKAQFKVEWITPHGKRKTRFFQTDDEATGWLEGSNLRAEMQLASPISPDAGKNLAAYVRHWLQFAGERYSANTLVNYKYILSHHVIPCRVEVRPGVVRRMGDLPLRDITWFHMYGVLRAKLREQPYKRNTLITFWTAMSAVLSDASQDRLIVQNPLLGRKPRGVRELLSKRGEPTVLQRSLTQEQADAFVTLAQREPTYVGLLLMLDGGLRIGEACGLQIPEVSLAENRMHIVRQRTQRGKETAPKWEHTRMVELSTRLRAVLEDVIRTRRAEAMTRGWRPVPLWVVVAPDGGPATQARLSRATVRLFKQLGIRDGYTPHSLRHTFGRLHAVKGASMKWLQEQMGHRSIATTNQYTEGIQFSDPDAADRLERLAPGATYAVACEQHANRGARKRRKSPRSK